MMAPNAPPAEERVELNLIDICLKAHPLVQGTLVLLLVMSLLVWIVAILKYFQVGRIRSRSLSFERAARQVQTGAELYELGARGKGSAGGRVLFELYSRAPTTNLERLRAIADRAIVNERAHARSMMNILGSIAASAPFIGLFGTVFGILAVFRVMGEGASLTTIAPKIGEALVTTGIGLFAAIPALVFYNSIDKKVGNFIDELEGAAGEWVTLIAETEGARAQGHGHAQHGVGAPRQPTQPY